MAFDRPGPPDPRRPGRRAIAAGMLALAAIVLVFLSEPILHFADRWYTAADVTQSMALFNLGEPHPGSNDILGDTVVQFQPWIQLSKGTLGAGELPLWNPDNGTGAPLLGNYQSAVFSPFTLPYYVFGTKLALIVAAALKLFVAGGCTLVFLRVLGLSLASALLGAIVFMFSGQMVLLLAYPHSGVTAFLPAALLAVELTIRAAERGRERARADRVRIAAASAGLCAVLTAALYAGHPEPFAFVALIAGAYALVRLWRAWGTLGRDRAALRVLIAPAACLAAAAAVAACLGAPQVLPFFEYLAQCDTGKSRVTVAMPSPLRNWPLALFPDALGNPRPEYLLHLAQPDPNYMQVNCSYVAGVALALAAVGVALWRADRRVRFFVVAAALWLVLSADLLGLGRAYDESPIGRYAVLWRSQPVWVFAIAVLAACGFEHLTRGVPRRATALALLVVGGAAVAACAWGARELLAAFLGESTDEQLQTAAANIRARELTMIGAFAAALLALVLLQWLRSRTARAALAALVLAAVFVQSGWALRDYNPTVEDRFVWPRTPALRTLQEHVGDARLLVLGDNGMPPSTNLMYGLSTLATYDALGIERFEMPFTLFFRPNGNWRDIQSARKAHLKLFGVEYVLTCGGWVAIDTEYGEHQLQRQTVYHPMELHSDHQVVQEFVAGRNGMSSLAVLSGRIFLETPTAPGLELTLTDVASGAVVAERRVPASELEAEAFSQYDLALTRRAFEYELGWHGSQTLLEFPPIADSKGRRYRLVLRSPDATSQEPLLLWRNAEMGPKGAGLYLDGTVRKGTMLFDFGYGRPEFEPVARVANFTLHRFSSGLGPYYSVARAVRPPSRKHMWVALSRPFFDPYRCVLLEPEVLENLDAPVPSREELSSGPPGVRATVLERSSTRVRLRVERDEPGWLVACQSNYPGWRATVNGVETPIEIANQAFCAVAVPAGASEVVLEYRPLSFRIGVWIALAGIVLALLGGAWYTRRRQLSP